MSYDTNKIYIISIIDKITHTQTYVYIMKIIFNIKPLLVNLD